VSRILHRRPSAGLVVALVALFVALGSGGAYAAFKLPTNSVGSQQLKNHSVGPAKLTTWVNAQLDKVSKLDTGKGGTDGTNGTNGTNGTSGTSGTSGSTGTSGPQGPQGTQGTQGTQGVAGQEGVQGPQGQAGAASLLTWTYGDIQVPDPDGDCGTWATDTYDTAMEVTPQANGSYLVSKYLTGSFVTIAGADQPNPTSCPGTPQTGGTNGSFQGIETWTVGTGPTSFDPTAVCASCSTATSSEQQNADFMSAYFPGSTYSGPQNFDFVYHTASKGSWVHSNTPDNNTGNITG
jgi:Collagen triple helix repeat (20 copies)